MEKLGKLYEGKAKKLYATNDPDVLWVEYMNQATAGNGAKKAQIQGKGELNNRITTLIFKLLAKRGIPSHFIKQISDNEQLVRKMTMFPLEIIMRNVAAGSFSKRYGVKEGSALKQPILEFCYKSDELGDPFINDDDLLALGLATREQLEVISAKTREINRALIDIFKSIDVNLIDFKIEMGVTSDGTILLADEITPDTCRLWNATADGSIEHLDKDLFRRDLGNIIPAYEDICSRLEDLAKSKGIA
ncbi:phosphoribosylaminoimidazolesuccinocarboxamide synthase [Pseudoscardovia suis]|uniref:Phosphoribosylaminoimidazole-succinocarboxamide synthase n=1 Tax=Pseudoscardovia suis TaxID=987063 RepID=A0A261F247_9BIFI|nr:phosphoribosylaminoimidazolesuccinocarboxamide synthase [Pseudoscardovia suis]OZG52996.1 phosphoribosylaminoimidazolesuccinocarboxamide synthase [Pseudoscardovia suis]PJJ68502.1 phosphoribosylaminoimidazole-succinocarboxamide synthase [Pseudoscardovia suis]